MFVVHTCTAKKVTVKVHLGEFFSSKFIDLGGSRSGHESSGRLGHGCTFSAPTNTQGKGFPDKVNPMVAQRPSHTLYLSVHHTHAMKSMYKYLSTLLIHNVQVTHQPYTYWLVMYNNMAL